MVKVGFIGMGYIVSDRHLPNLKQLEGVKVAALSDIDKNKEGMAAGHGAKFYSDYRQMLDKEKLDAVFICVPTFIHGKPEMECIERGLHLFIEKPIALSISTAKEIERGLKTKGLISQVGHQWRYFDTAVFLKELLAAKAGKIGLFEGKWWHGLPPVRWWWKTDQGGGQVTEQTCHIFDFARFLFGEVDEVYANFATRIYSGNKDLNIEDVSAVNLRFKNGLIGSVTSTSGAVFPKTQEIYLKCLAENLAATWGGHSGEVSLFSKNKEEIVYPRVEPFFKEAESFIAAVQGKKAVLKSPYSDAIETLKISLAASESAKTGKPVKIDSLK